MHWAVSSRAHILESRSIPYLLGELTSLRFYRPIGLAVLAVASYYIGTELGFALTPNGSPTSAFWPPNAILLAILLLTPKRDWYIPLLAVLPLHLAFQSNIGVPMTTSLGWFVTNTGEALLGAFFVRRFTDPRTMFENLHGTLVFLVFAVILAPFTTSFVDSAVVIATGWGQHFWSIWTARLFSNSLAELVVVPSLVTAWVKSAGWRKETNRFRYFEATALYLALIIVSFAIFSFQPSSARSVSALIYLPLSLLLLAAFRFGVAGSSISILTLAIISINGAFQGKGPFIAESMHNNVISLQILLSSVAAPLILLTAVITERRTIEHSLREVAQRLLGAQQEERERIGRELHDDVGQQLALVESEMDELRDRLDPSFTAEITDLVAKIANASQSTRELSHELHPSNIEHLGLETSLRNLCQVLVARKSLHIDFFAKGLQSEVPPDISTCLYRISQEAFHNVLRHSGASKISVILVKNKTSIQLSIADDGAGFDPANLKHLGLGMIGMRERLRAFNGELRLSSAAGKGTTLDAVIPL